MEAVCNLNNELRARGIDPGTKVISVYILVYINLYIQALFWEYLIYTCSI